MKECYARAEQDKKELSKKLGKNIEYLFLPNPEYPEVCHNPEICPEPKYLLLCPEPGSPQEGIRTACFFPPFLHYCAYKYLCDEKFDYYITDLSKGAMEKGYVDKTKKERYPVWLSLFEKEWKLLDRPKIIAVGSTLYDGMMNGFKDCNGKKHKFGCVQSYIFHFTTGKGASRMKEEYENIKRIFPKLDSYRLEESELKKFANILKEHLNLERCNVDSDYYEFLIKDSLKSHYRDIVFPVYRYNFEQFIEKGNIIH